MWEEVARRVINLGGAIHLRNRIVGIERTDSKVVSIEVADGATGEVRRVTCDYFLSTIPVKDLITMLKPEQTYLARVATDLPYRDFMTAGLLLRSMRGRVAPPDNWIYIQNRMFVSDDYRSLITGARHWLRIQEPSGWDWSISAGKAMICGQWKTTNS